MRRLFVSIIIGGAGSLAWLVGLIMCVQRVRLLTVGKPGTGTVVDEFVSDVGTGTARRSRSRGQATFSPVIEVIDVTTGTPIRFRSSFGTSETLVTLGARMPVRYLPGQPDQAEVDAFLPMWGLPAMAMLFGTIMLTAWWFA